MSVDQHTIFWSEGARIDRVLAHIFKRLRTATGRRVSQPKIIPEEEFLETKKIKATRVTIELPSTTAFYDQYLAPGTSQSDLRKIITNDTSRISPLTDQPSIMLAQRAVDANEAIDLLHIRQSSLDAIDEKARKLGLVSVSISPQSAPQTSLPTAISASSLHIERRFKFYALVALLVGTWGLLTALNSKAEERLASITSSEAILRVQLLERRSQERDLGALGELAQMNPEALSPQGTLQRITQLTSAFPTTAWWSEFDLDSGVARVTGQSTNAGETLSAVTAALPSEDVAFDSAVADIDDEKQSFVIRIAAEPRNHD